MIKAKVFHSEGHVGLEMEMNEWLINREGIDVISMTQTEVMSTSTNSWFLTVTIIYKDG